MTRIDWAILAFAALTGAMGYRRGLVRTLLALVGLVVGAVVGAHVAPHVLHAGSRSSYSALVSLAGAVVGATLFRAAAGFAGGVARKGLHLAPPLRLLDSIGGLAAGLAWGLALAWVAGAVAAQLPGHPTWHRAATSSRVLSR